MLRGNVYGLVITVLSLVIALVMTLQQVREGGVTIEVTVRSLPPLERPADPGEGRRQEVSENTH